MRGTASVVDARDPEDLAGDLGRRGGMGGAVLQNRERVADFHLDLDSMGEGDALGDLADAARDERAHARIEGPHRAGEMGALGNDVIGRARMDLGHGKHGALQRVGIARDDGLQRLDQCRSRHDGIEAAMGFGRVGAASGDADIEEVRCRHHRPGADLELAVWAAGGVVEPVDLVAGEALEQPVGQHGAGAAEPFLRRLEHEQAVPSKSRVSAR